MTPVEILTEARALIARPGGWCQGGYERDGAYCAIGALSEANKTRLYVKYSACREFLRKARALMFHELTDYNDEYGRTKEEIIAWFDDAIGLAKKEAA
jgi:hypothetical protein